MRKLPSGRYQAGYLAPDNSVIYAEQTFRTKAAADRWLVLTEAELMSGTWMPPERRRETVGEWADRWLDQGQWQPRTREEYEEKLRGFVIPRWGEQAIGEVARDDVRVWIGELRGKGYSAGTIRHAVGILGRILRQAVEAGVMQSNPCDRLGLPSPRHAEMRVLTIGEVEGLAAVILRPELQAAGHGARPTGRHRPTRPSHLGSPRRLLWSSSR
ncbi:MAG: tyrosine-type recombinase/integrase [Acidimicrobiales bacterium]